MKRCSLFINTNFKNKQFSLNNSSFTLDTFTLYKAFIILIKHRLHNKYQILIWLIKEINIKLLKGDRGVFKMYL